MQEPLLEVPVFLFVLRYLIPLFVLAIAFLSGCDKGNKNANELPDTKITPHIINLEGDNRLKSTVKLSWMGSDKDGYITGYEYSQDNITWFYTTKSDTTMIFSIEEGSDTTDIEFYVRSIDNKQAKDLTPAYLKIPIKNTKPEATFDEDLSSSDSALIVATLFWNATDADGIDNLKEVQFKINNGDWFTLSKSQKNLTLVPTNPSVAGATDCQVYLNPESPESKSINGLVLDDTNTFYVRAIDIANSISVEDTLSGLYIAKKGSNLLVIGGDRDYNSFYTSRISNVVSNFDYIDYAVDNGKWQPAFWNTTFYLMLSQYEKACIFSDKKEYTNASTGLSSLIIESSAPAVRLYNNKGGKIFTIGYFQNPMPSNSLIFEVYPIQSMDSTSNLALLIKSDSALTSKETGYPNLGTTSFPDNISPFSPSSSAQVIYTGKIDPFSGYKGSNVMGVKQVIGGKTDMVFVAAGLNVFNADYTKVDSLFNQVLNKEF